MQQNFDYLNTLNLKIALYCLFIAQYFYLNIFSSHDCPRILSASAAGLSNLSNFHLKYLEFLVADDKSINGIIVSNGIFFCFSDKTDL